MTNNLRVAVAQVTPITFDMKACATKICNYVDAAADKNAQLVVFGEMCAGGFPDWRPSVTTFGDEKFFKKESEWTSKRLFTISEVIPGPTSDHLCHKAKERKI